MLRVPYYVIYFKNVSKIYNEHCIGLDSVTFKIEPKEFVSVVGRSGSGKSTLIKLLIAETKPTQGRIFFDKQDVHRIKSRHLPKFRRRIGVIFQDYKLLADKTAYENVAFAMQAAGKSDEEIKRDVPQVLELVGLKDRFNNYPDELSGGEKQRVAIARAMVHRPDVIVADEPTGNLDPINTWDIIRLLVKINEFGTTVILATHDKEIINALGRRVISLEQGRIIRDEEKGRFILS